MRCKTDESERLEFTKVNDSRKRAFAVAVRFSRKSEREKVGRIGFEPMTNGLKVHCSTS